jgi:Flp pilus assembly pilin Flp
MFKRLWCNDGILKRLCREDEGMLTFEWSVLVTVLVIGVTTSLSAVRDAINQDLNNITQAINAVPQLNSNSSAPASSGSGVATPSSATAANGLMPVSNAVQALQNQTTPHWTHRR